MNVDTIWSDYENKCQESGNRLLSINTILAAKYLVGPVLGQGGFGITYIGFDLNMETYVAIKEYFPVELVSRDTSTAYGDRVFSVSGEKKTVYEQGLKKYVEEAQRISQFAGREGVVSIKDFFYENNTAYIVMEYIHGKSLKEYLEERGSLSEEESLRIMRPVIETLAQIHDAGIIHRDISPDNIMLTLDGGQVKEVKLIDFGSARMTAKNDQKSLTIILKHGYAPEEQYRTHGEQGPWTDVYAVCAVLYRMLSGKTPMPAMDRLFQDELNDLVQTGTTVSKNTKQTILKGLAIKKEDRIQAMRELADALYYGKNVYADAKKRKWLIGAGAVCAVIAVVIGWMILSQMHAKKETQVIDVVENTNIDTESVEFASDTVETVVFPESEELVIYSPKNSISGTSHYIVLCKPDGTVSVKSGSWVIDDDIADEVQIWSHIVAVAAGWDHTLGLRSDGTVKATGSNYDGQCEVENWKDIVQIEAGSFISFGLTKDGTVLVAGSEEHLGTDSLRNIANWEDIREISYVDRYDGEYMIGIKADGSVWVEGDVLYETVTGMVIEDGWQSVSNLIIREGCLIGIEEDGDVKTAIIKQYDYFEKGQQRFIEQYEQLPKMKQLDENGYWGVTLDGEFILLDGVDDMEPTFSYRLYHASGDELDQWNELIAVKYVDDVDETYAYGLKEDGTVLELHLDGI